MPYTDTPFSQAIFKMFDNLALNLVDTLPNNFSKTPLIKAYLFGGCAVHIHIGSRVTNDVDAKLERVGNFPNNNIKFKPVYFKGHTPLNSI